MDAMKIYQSVPVTLSYQNFGSAWLGILRGTTEAIESVFNGLYNLRATNGEQEFHDHTKCLSTFWTSPRAMRRFFFNRYYLPRTEGEGREGQLIRAAMRHAHEQLAEMRKHHEGFMTFETKYGPETFGSGTITAERPDHDMKDAIIFHAYTDKNDEKNVDAA